MSHHAYFFAGDSERGIATATAYAEKELGIQGTNNPDILIQRFGLFSVEDARKISDIAYRSPTNGNQKILIVAAPRIFEQAQNALLKIFEEPPAGVTLVLVIPSEGILLPTLRSRLLPLPHTVQPNATEHRATGEIDPLTKEFIRANTKEKEKLIAKLVDQSKSDTEEVKQVTRASAITLIEGLTKYFYTEREKAKSVNVQQELLLFLSDLNRFVPIMHTRSAPLKLIFEHILITFPRSIDGISVV